MADSNTKYYRPIPILILRFQTMLFMLFDIFSLLNFLLMTTLVLSIYNRKINMQNNSKTCFDVWK